MAPLALFARRLAATAACGLLAAFALVTAAGAQTADEREIKAAFLYRFGGYVEWPEQAFARSDSPVVIAVAGNDPVYEQLAQIVSGRTLGRRPVVARRVQKGEPLTGIHVLFVGAGTASWSPELLAQARRRPILVVTEADGGLPAGSVINFATLDNRVRFDVSMEAAETNGLRLSAALLSVARQVRGKAS